MSVIHDKHFIDCKIQSTPAQDNEGFSAGLRFDS